ncbi:hypothetical protein GOBAR_AA20177 [Gossypium barbadense]|uniref:Uncharacterized protein n=1 Tax=Gossypium barbadense TaxID=3634 RepID=A0A2P5XAY9_GOSBA|nr:hypothetical protein GOBAR_AA20177 [Gossypium barbadense]
MPGMRSRQAKQIEVGHVYIEAVRKAMTVNSRKAQKMNAKLYSRDLETFVVQEYISHSSGLPPRSYIVNL